LTVDNYFALNELVMENIKNSQIQIRSGKPCIVVTTAYDMMVYEGLIDDKRI